MTENNSLIEESCAALTQSGALAEAIEGFRFRPSQQALAAEIAAAIERRGALVAEAGTGTGKTFAYLVPALLSGKRTIISTGTRALQDQLFHRDLPRVRAALGSRAKIALLKGRANYLCLQRLHQTGEEGRFDSRTDAAAFVRVKAWSGKTLRGDLAELVDLPDDASLRSRISSTTDNCLGSECPFWEECFVVKARMDAAVSDVVVVNHHLLLSDLALREEGFGEILPGANCFIIDEAHQLPDLATLFFGESVSARMLTDLASDTLAACKETPAALATLQSPVRLFEHHIRHFRAAIDRLPPRSAAGTLLRKTDAEDSLLDLIQALSNLHEALGGLDDASAELLAARQRAQKFIQRLQQWCGETDATISSFDPDDDDADAEAEADAAGENARVRWFEVSSRGFVLNSTPLDVSSALQKYRAESRAAWIFTSATLAVNHSFEHLNRRLGLNHPKTLLQESPFNWDEQTLCYLPSNLPDPNQRHYTAAIVEAAREVLVSSKGRAFLLFTSHRALREAAELLKNDRWPLFVQGTAPRHQLLEQFMASGNGVLLGAASFWEGVDVPGDALSVVVIDRIPFAVPDDPVFEARLNAIRQAGGNPFRDEQVPLAAISLKQGVGRLIRSDRDRGVLMLCDPRLTEKSYGKIFLDSLPPMRRTRNVADVAAFFAGTAQPND